MAISKLNAEQFANMAVNAAGVISSMPARTARTRLCTFRCRLRSDRENAGRNVPRAAQRGDYVLGSEDQRIAAPRIERRYPLETPCRNSAPAHHPHLRRRYGQSFRPRRKRMGTNRVNADQKDLERSARDRKSTSTMPPKHSWRH